MSCFKFVQIEIVTKDFYNQKQLNDIFRFEVKKAAISVKVPSNNEKDWEYIVGY